MDINGITKDFFASNAVQATGASGFTVYWKYLISDADPGPLEKTSSGIKADDLHVILEQMSTTVPSTRVIRITIT